MSGRKLSDVGITLPVQSIYEISSTQNHRLGEKLVLGDRTFRYAKAGAVALTVGKMCQAAPAQSTYNNKAWASGGAVAQNKVTITLTAAVTINSFADGYLHGNDATGEGQCYKIKEHPAAAEAGTLEVTLYDDIIVAFVSGSEVTLTTNKWKDAVITPNGGLTAPAVGVPLVAVTEAYYYWSQVKGPCPILTYGTVVIGQIVGIGTTADGACGPLAAYTTNAWGRVLAVNAQTEYSLIDLCLE